MDGTEGRLTDKAPYAQIIDLRCQKCGARFNTKNIAPIGCRSIRLGSMRIMVHPATSPKQFEANILRAVACDDAGHTLEDLEVDPAQFCC